MNIYHRSVLKLNKAIPTMWPVLPIAPQSLFFASYDVVIEEKNQQPEITPGSLLHKPSYSFHHTQKLVSSLLG
jgi:hypothetical protein